MINLADAPVFGLASPEKQTAFLAGLNRLSAFHYEACPAYRRVLDGLGEPPLANALEDVPFLPVRLFKEYRLASVAEPDIVKTMTSSGTSGQRVSQIYLDKETAALQTRALARIVSDFIGNKRLPMLIIDRRETIADRSRFSARAAGVLGFSMFGRKTAFSLDSDMQPDFAAIEAFAEEHRGQPLLVFGFTFIVWKHLVLELERSGRRLPLEDGILIHGGGWKQLAASAVDGAEFKARLAACTGMRSVHNYYGMVEQTGSIFMECPEGHLHAPVFSDVLIRDPLDFSVLPFGNVGLVQLMSLLPHSYPGHSLLSEDLGEVIGRDDCACGRKGHYFRIHGRLKDAEVRGCSDTYPG